MSDFKPKPKHPDQNGIVSIIVVSILTITLALIAVGFSKLADRELRQASDRELSNQAYYAAQSGLNDAVAWLAAGGQSFAGCSWPTGPGLNGDKYFTHDLSNGANEAKYSCISINNVPNVLNVPDLKRGTPQVVVVSASNLKNLYISWQNNPSANVPLGALGTLPNDSAAAGKTGVLRVGLYAVPTTNPPNGNDGLSSLSRAYYLYPNAGGGNISCASPAGGCVNYASDGYNVSSSPEGPTGNNGNFVSGTCTTSSRPSGVFPTNPYYCDSEITGLTGSANTYYLYLTAQYSDLSVTIQGTDGGSPPHLVTFADSQAVIDVTGQGSDVIQRIQATVSLNSQFDVPAYAVQSMETLCKDLIVPIVPSGQYGAATALDSSLDPACVNGGPGGSINSSAGDISKH